MHFSTMKWRPCALLICSLWWFLCNKSCEGLLKLPPNVTVPAVYAFGDSIVDQGNNNNLSTVVKCDFLPYGTDLNGGEVTGRFSNSLTPVDLIAGELGIKQMVPAYLDPNLTASDIPTGVSFASGGSGYDPQTSTILRVISLTQQLEYFKEYIGKLQAMVGVAKSNYILANGLFLVVAGSDDIANTYYSLGLRRVQYDINSYANFLATSASSFYLELYKLGARRLAVFSIPPVGCVPFQRTLQGGLMRGCADNMNQAAQLVNGELSSEIASLNKAYPDARIKLIDVYSPLLNIIQNPQNYGISEVYNGCCGTGRLEIAFLCNKYDHLCEDHNTYLFWDSYHPTLKGYSILVQEILQSTIKNFF